MKVRSLIDILKEYDPEDNVAIGSTVLLGVGLSAIVKTGNLYSCNISGTVVLHVEKPRVGPEWSDVRGEEDNSLIDTVLYPVPEPQAEIIPT